MQSSRLLDTILKGIGGKDYGAYQSLKGEYSYPDFKLIISQIPKDPYAPPHTGIYRILLSHGFLGISPKVFESKIAGIAYRDYLARSFSSAAESIARRGRGTGYSGVITLDTPSQAILERSAVVFTENGIEVRFFIGLPARGRKIDAGVAAAMLGEELPLIVETAFASLDAGTVKRHIETAEDSEFLRSQLGKKGLVAFIADGAVLPRRSGASDEPMTEDTVVPFYSPESLRVSIELPHTGTVTGMGVPEGITLIVGGGYHGKSTLLHVIETGIYNHIPGDGREQCAADPLTIKVRAYSGRPVMSVDISSFINNLPLEKDTRDFSSANASGSTSQAAAIVEALEVDARVLLMDEDTCAANFMMRDRKMQDLVKKKDEPITPFIDRVRWLYEEKGVSSILVFGGSGDYFEVADTVIQMTGYRPRDVTAKAKAIANEFPAKRNREQAEPQYLRDRFVYTESIDPLNQYGKKSVYVKEPNRIHFGATDIDLTDVEQIMEISQTKTIAEAILFFRNFQVGPVSLKELIDRYSRLMESEGLDGLSTRISGYLAQVRGMEIAAALNRLRILRIVNDS